MRRAAARGRPGIHDASDGRTNHADRGTWRRRLPAAGGGPGPAQRRSRPGERARRAGPGRPDGRGLLAARAPLGVDKYGTTGEEERRGESLDQRLAQEVEDVEPPDGDGIGDLDGGDGEPLEPEEGETRSGRLSPADEVPGRRTDVYADDVGIDGGAASAEEAAVYTTDEEEEQGREG